MHVVKKKQIHLNLAQVMGHIGQEMVRNNVSPLLLHSSMQFSGLSQLAVALSQVWHIQTSLRAIEGWRLKNVS
jgi:hypothetical protein